MENEELNSLDSNTLKLGELEELREKLKKLKAEFEELNSELKPIKDEKKVSDVYNDKRIEEAKSNADLEKKAVDKSIKTVNQRITRNEKIVEELEAKEDKTPADLKRLVRAREVVENSKKEIEALEARKEEIDKELYNLEKKIAKENQTIDELEAKVKAKYAEAKEVYDRIVGIENEFKNNPAFKNYADNAIIKKYEKDLEEKKKTKEKYDRVEEIREIINRESVLSRIFTTLVTSKETMEQNADYAEIDPPPTEPVKPTEPVDPGVPPKVPDNPKDDWTDADKEKYELEKEQYDLYLKRDAIYQKELAKYKKDKKAYDEKDKIYKGYKAYHDAKKSYDSAMNTMESTGITKEEAEAVLENTKLNKETSKFENTKAFNKKIKGVDKAILYDESMISQAKESLGKKVEPKPEEKDPEKEPEEELEEEPIVEEEPLDASLIITEEEAQKHLKDERKKEKREMALATRGDGFFAKVKRGWGSFKSGFGKTVDKIIHFFDKDYKVGGKGTGTESPDIEKDPKKEDSFKDELNPDIWEKTNGDKTITKEEITKAWEEEYRKNAGSYVKAVEEAEKAEKSEKDDLEK